MSRWRGWCRVGAWAAGLLAASAGARPDASRVLVLANASDPDSLRIAAHYASARGVPRANLLALPLPAAETITWGEFVPLLWEPLIAELVRAGWIDAMPMRLADREGRTKYAPHSHRIAALVLCRGVPLRIAHDPALPPPPAAAERYRTNAGAVDAELSLLATPNYPINGFVPNPLFQQVRPRDFEHARAVRVARLDGPTVADALALVDGALAAERDGLRGRAYIDLSDRDPAGNRWFEAALAQLRETRFPVEADAAPALFPATARFDAPVLYLGWYAADAGGPMTLPGFRFPPGAIAFHLHSFSAATLRSGTEGWAGPLVARGVTATMGNVFEPYLAFCHRPDLLLRRLLAGDTLVEAAYFALPALSWQQVLIGDPLYRPFPAGRPEPAVPVGYAALLRMERLLAEDRSDDTLAAGLAALREQSHLAVAVAVARLLRARGDREDAASALGTVVTALSAPPPDQWALAAEAARLLAELGRARQAMDLWRLLLMQPLTEEVRRVWQPWAAAVAEAAGEREQAAAWRPGKAP